MRSKVAPIQLIVHIGATKTGSSSIQETLRLGSELLQSRGVKYLGLMLEHAEDVAFPWQDAGGWPLLIAQGRDSARHQLAGVLRGAVDVARQRGWARVIWSNETLFGNHDLVLPALRELHDDGVDVKVVLYVRRHDAWAQSAYAQWGIKHKSYPGEIRTFSEWYAENAINFTDGLQQWLACDWIDLDVRNFDECEDVVVDFLDCCGVDRKNVALRQANETPNSVALMLWGLFNNYSESPVLPAKLEGMLRAAGLVDRAPVEFELADLMPRETDLQRIREESEIDRREIDKLLQRCGHSPMGTAPLPLRPVSVSPTQVNAALLLMLHKQHEELSLLRQKLRDLEGVVERLRQSEGVQVTSKPKQQRKSRKT